MPCSLEGPTLWADGALMSLTRSVFLEPRLWLCGMVQGEITFFQGDITHQSLNHCYYRVLMWITQTSEYKWATNLNMNIQELLESYYYIWPSRGQLRIKNPWMLETRANRFGSFCQKSISILYQQDKIINLVRGLLNTSVKLFFKSL